MPATYRRIEAGHYQTSIGGQLVSLYAITERRCTDRALRHPNRWGRYTSASSRKVTSWAYRIEGRPAVQGFGSRAAALACAREMLA